MARGFDSLGICVVVEEGERKKESARSVCFVFVCEIHCGDSRRRELRWKRGRLNWRNAIETRRHRERDDARRTRSRARVRVERDASWSEEREEGGRSDDDGEGGTRDEGAMESGSLLTIRRESKDTRGTQERD